MYYLLDASDNCEWDLDLDLSLDLSHDLSNSSASARICSAVIWLSLFLHRLQCMYALHCLHCLVDVFIRPLVGVSLSVSIFKLEVLGVEVFWELMDISSKIAVFGFKGFFIFCFVFGLKMHFTSLYQEIKRLKTGLRKDWTRWSCWTVIWSGTLSIVLWTWWYFLQFFRLRSEGLGLWFVSD